VTTLGNELVSVADFIRATYPTSTVLQQNVPLTPNPNTFVVRFQNDEREVSSGGAIKANREYQIIYIDAKAPDILTKMDAISRKCLYGRLVIPIKGSLRYIRVNGFSFGQILDTENDLEACIGVLQTEIREARDMEAYQKIMNVNARIT
jgi:hypothetical protein